MYIHYPLDGVDLDASIFDSHFLASGFRAKLLEQLEAAIRTFPCTQGSVLIKNGLGLTPSPRASATRGEVRRLNAIVRITKVHQARTHVKCTISGNTQHRPSQQTLSFVK